MPFNENDIDYDRLAESSERYKKHLKEEKELKEQINILSNQEQRDLDAKLAMIDKITAQQRLYSKLNKTEYDAKVNALKEEIKQQAVLDSIKKKSLSQVQRILENQREQTQEQIKQKENELEITNYVADRKEIEKDLAKLREEEEKSTQRINALKEAANISENKLLNLYRSRGDILNNISKKYSDNLKDAQDNYANLLMRKIENPDSVSDDELGLAKDVLGKASGKLNVATQLITIVKNIGSMLDKALNSITQKMSNAIDAYSEYKGKIDARLQTLTGTTEKSFDSINSTLQASMQTTGYVSYTDVIKNIDKLSSEGIAYNIEERAFLQTVSEKMVASFEATNANLTRMIRLQQADMTRIMLGNEATLTQLFNEYFEDTSYLADNVADSVAGQVFDASATMDVENSSAFQFAVQKWLGALYEVGASDSTVSQIAQAINMLGTGQSSQFTESPVSTLLNMAIARSDFSLADVLNQGLNVDFIDSMMTSMITLLTDIKENTSSQVTLSAYADVFGISMSDLRAFANLKEDIVDLQGYNQTAEQAEAEVKNQLKLLEQRTTIAEKIDNIIENFSYIVGENIADNTVQYILYRTGDIVRELGEGTVVGLAGIASQLASGAWALNEYGKKVGGIGATFSTSASEEGSSWSILDALGVGWIKDVIGFVGNVKTALGTVLNGFKIDTLVNSTFGAMPYVTHERGAGYIGVIPEYGTVSSSTSRSMGMSVPNSSSRSRGISSSEDAYGLVPESEFGGNTVEERIASLNDIAETPAYEYISTETAEAIGKSATIQDVYTELFLNQDYPLRVHVAYFDDKAEGQLISYINSQDNNSNLRAIRNKVEGTVHVDTELNPGDIGSILSAIRSS